MAKAACNFRARVEPCLREIITNHPGETTGIFATAV